MEKEEKDSILQNNDEEPVFYCARCLSLKIRYLDKIEDSEYCDECGSSDVKQASIEEWEKMYEERYGHKFLNNKY